MKRIKATSSALKVGQLTVLIHESSSVLKTLRGQKGIKESEHAVLWYLLLQYVYMVYSKALLVLKPAFDQDKNRV